MFPDPRGAIPLGGKEMRETDAKSTLKFRKVGQTDVSNFIHRFKMIPEQSVSIQFG